MIGAALYSLLTGLAARFGIDLAASKLMRTIGELAVSVVIAVTIGVWAYTAGRSSADQAATVARLRANLAAEQKAREIEQAGTQRLQAALDELTQREISEANKIRRIESATRNSPDGDLPAALRDYLRGLRK